MNWKDEYSKLLGCADINKIDFETAQSIKDKYIPKKLYKYRAVNECSLNNLRNNTVWVDKPSEYNDSFEFNENLNFDELYETLARVKFDEFFERIQKIVPIQDELKEESRIQADPLKFLFEELFKKGNMPKENIDKMFSFLENLKKMEAQNIKIKKNKLMQDKMKVCCFCEANDELGMWSYYANSHKGFCIEYNTESWFPFDIRRRILYPVIYQDTMYDATPHLLFYIENGTFNNLYPIISGSTKSTRYIEEKEWRFIFNIGESFQPQNYPMNCLNRVFLGAKISNEDKTKVIDICKENKIDVFQTVMSLDGFTMEFIPLDF